jgi:uncharacterized membrane protein YgdD (TMEM256/DUF423 family)
MNWSATGAILLALAVILGAFGAHGLRGRLDAYLMSVYEKAVFYHFIHALGLLVVSIMPKTGALSASTAQWVCGLLLAGILIFSGSLYLLAADGTARAGRGHTGGRGIVHRRVGGAGVVSAAPEGLKRPTAGSRIRLPSGYCSIEQFWKTSEGLGSPAFQLNE